jgi:hypothetical protein
MNARITLFMLFAIVQMTLSPACAPDAPKPTEPKAETRPWTPLRRGGEWMYAFRQNALFCGPITDTMLLYGRYEPTYRRVTVLESTTRNDTAVYSVEVRDSVAIMLCSHMNHRDSVCILKPDTVIIDTIEVAQRFSTNIGGSLSSLLSVTLPDSLFKDTVTEGQTRRMATVDDANSNDTVVYDADLGLVSYRYRVCMKCGCWDTSYELLWHKTPDGRMLDLSSPAAARRKRRRSPFVASRLSKTALFDVLGRRIPGNEPFRARTTSGIVVRPHGGAYLPR